MTTNSTHQIRIILADDHPLFQDGLASLLERIDEFDIVGKASNGKELIELYHQSKPDIILTDIKMPEMDGIEATMEIRKTDSDVGIICLSMYDESELIVDILEAGANGYLVKNADKDEIIEAIHKVYTHESYYCKKTFAQLRESIHRNHYKKIAKPSITGKELEIIKLLCEELTAKEIAERLFISPRTVEQHKLNIQEKLGVKNAIGIVVYALKHRLI